MISLERTAYLVKHYFPPAFKGMELLARATVVLRYGARVRHALSEARIDGTVEGQHAVIRALGEQDVTGLAQFFEDLADDHLEYFRPHPFDQRSLRRVIRSRAFMNYGLLVDGEWAGYALLKIAPTGSAFIGLLVHPRYLGIGLGSFLVGYLYWQASLAGLRARSTISRHNPASLRSHRAVAEFNIVSDLPNDYLLIEFPVAQRRTPALDIA